MKCFEQWYKMEDIIKNDSVNKNNTDYNEFTEIVQKL